MVNSTHTISQSVCRLFISVLSNSEFIAISKPPWLCPLLFGGLSCLYTVYRLAGKYSEDDIDDLLNSPAVKCVNEVVREQF